jgi:hypothetical protein
MCHNTSSVIFSIPKQRVLGSHLRKSGLDLFGVSVLPFIFSIPSIFVNPPQNIPENPLTMLNMRN